MIQKRTLLPDPMEDAANFIESQEIAEVCKFHGEWLLRFPNNDRLLFNDDQLLTFAKRHGYEVHQ